ncbi:hypothetical protein [Kineosporia sp. A_224]|uniref:hypothetical protein n=1 Tax=Kineosporia sp. A_224 TaxID=1962180 RepID=UPI000B4A93D5|nr:hypothetical protein [Kineosporia sp. A_224]
MTRSTSMKSTSALLAAVTAAVLGGTALAGPAVPAAPTGGGGRGALVAAAPVLPASGARHRADGDGDTREDRAERAEQRRRDRYRHRTATVRSRAQVRVHRDDRERRRATWRQRRVTAGGLVARNRADALAEHCTDCHAVAVSVQVVVNGRNAGRVDVANLADAVTVDCTRCTATALAYQFVVVGPGRLTLTRDARARLSDLRREMRDVARHTAVGAVTAKEDALAAEVADVLRGGVVDAARPDGASTLSTRRSGSDGVTVRVRRAHDGSRGRSR